MEITGKVLGNNHPDVAICCNNIGLVYERQRNYSSALDWYRKSLDMKQNMLGETHPSTIKTLENMGRVYFALKDYDQAQDYYSRVLSALKSAHSDDQLGLANSCDNLGAVLYKRGDFDHSLEYLLQAVALREQLLGSGDQTTATSCTSVARVYDKLGQYSQALDYYQKAYDAMASLKGDDNPEVATLKNSILKNQYLIALAKGKLKSFMADHCLVARVASGNNPAVDQGMSGEYILLEFADWNLESTGSLFDKADELRQSPKDIVVMKDGIISRYHFENRMGLSFDVKAMAKDEKQKINQAYKKWKEEQNQ